MEFDPERPSTLHSDKAVRRILKTLNKLRSSNATDRVKKCEELIRFISKTMKDRLHDDLLQTTALWSLLNLLRMDTKNIQPIMLRCGVPGVIYDVMSISRPQHTSHYSSQLCTLLCSTAAEPLNAPSSILKSNQVFENFSASVDSVTSTVSASQHMAAFSPYLISDNNLLQMNTLFEPLLPPITNPSHANMHQLGTALEQDSVSLFASAPYPTYPTSPSRNLQKNTPASPQRHSPSSHRVPSPTRLTMSRESQRSQSSQSIRGVKDIISRSRHRRFSQPTHTQPSNDDILESYSSLVSSHGRSILPQHLSKLDPLSLNVTSALLSSADAKTAKPHRAESLIDMRFLRRIFVENVTVVEAQSLMAKMQDLFELFDKETTGYLPYSTFTRILLSLAPPHMLRSDTVAFLEKQVDSPDDKIDYREFAISGKVLIIEQKDGKPLPLARSWYNHVAHMPLPATLTWSHHVAYFRKRKSDTIIWLMRRANRAIQYYAYVEKAAERLLFVGKQAKAIGYLLECSDRALQAERNATFIRQKLMNRVQHAKQWKQTVYEAHRYLVTIASQAETLEQWRLQREIDKTKALEAVKPWIQPTYNRFYELQHRRNMTLQWLNETAAIALKKMEQREQHFEELISLGRRAAAQSLVHDNVQKTLRSISEHAHAHCISTDKALLTLLRHGKKAYDLLIHQMESLDWLIARGQNSLQHTQKQQETQSYLMTFAQYHTQKLNKRQEAFFYLSTRCQMVFSLRVRQQAALEYLRRIPQAIFENEEVVDRAFNWLVKRAARGKKHAERLDRAYRGLKFVAARSVVVTRKRHLAYADLKQLGLKYRVQSFEKLWVPLPGNKDRLRDEIKRIQQLDRRTADERRYLSLEEYIQTELRDAFDILANAYHSAPVAASDVPPQQSATEVIRRADSGVSIMGRGLTTRVVAPKLLSDKEPSSPVSKPSSPQSLSIKATSTKSVRPTTPGGNSSELGRIGFKKLIMDGKLLGLPKGTADAIYDSVDSDASGCISFDELWVWFSHEMRRKTLSRSSVSVSRILPAKERAIIALMKRFSDKNPVAHSNIGDMTAYDMIG